MIDKDCHLLENVAYKSCVDAFFKNKNKEEIIEHWLYVLDRKRYCEAKGVEKALELIDLYLEMRH